MQYRGSIYSRLHVVEFRSLSRLGVKLLSQIRMTDEALLLQFVFALRTTHRPAGAAERDVDAIHAAEKENTQQVHTQSVQGTEHLMSNGNGVHMQLVCKYTTCVCVCVYRQYPQQVV